MRYSLFLVPACLLVLAGCSSQPATEASATLLEGARLVNGDGSTTENSAILIEKEQITKVGRKGEIEAPAGAARVDLTGKTVIPALIDSHAHLGWEIVKTGTIGKDTYSKDNLIDHLKRAAYYGVAATQNLGIDPGETPYEVRASPVPGAALFRTAGRGMGMPDAGPGQEYWKPVAYGIRTGAEARAAVQELAAKKADIVKIWVDDRNGTVPKLTPALRRSVIDEAHKNNLRVAAHIYYLEDAKDLLRAGVDVFAHGVRDKDIDDEFLKLMKEHPNVVVIPNLPDNPSAPPDPAWLRETMPAAEVQKLADAQAKRTPEAGQRARDFFGVQSRNLAKLNAAGAKIAFGTDSGVTVGWTVHTELADMVAAGMTPAQVLTAATKTSAELVRLDALGMIAAGKSADLIVLDGNPLDDITNTRKIARVYQRGKELDRAALRESWTGSK
jgi:imidazolonepropionase-like amidohydrolase